MSNATNFINSYNKIDARLRAVFNMKASMGFSDMIRRVSPFSPIVRKYEDELLDYGRLRNAIIHKSMDNMIIAEPTNEVTEKFSHIAELICTPPKILEFLDKKNLVCARNDLSIKEVIKIITESGFSNIPIYKNNQVIGLINNKRIVESLGRVIKAGKNVDEFLDNSKVENIILSSDLGVYYDVIKSNSNLEEVMNKFESNKKLSVLLVSGSGSLLEMPINIITVFDLVRINKILEDY